MGLYFKAEKLYREGRTLSVPGTGRMSVTRLKGNSAGLLRPSPPHTHQHPEKNILPDLWVPRSQEKLYVQDSALPLSTAKALQTGLLGWRSRPVLPVLRSSLSLSLACASRDPD